MKVLIDEKGKLTVNEYTHLAAQAQFDKKKNPNIFAKKMKSTEQSKTLISYKFKFEGVEFLYYYDVIAVIKVLPEQDTLQHIKMRGKQNVPFVYNLLI